MADSLFGDRTPVISCTPPQRPCNMCGGGGLGGRGSSPPHVFERLGIRVPHLVVLCEPWWHSEFTYILMPFVLSRNMQAGRVERCNSLLWSNGSIYIWRISGINGLKHSSALNVMLDFSMYVRI
jgi:hypothetical protein